MVFSIIEQTTVKSFPPFPVTTKKIKEDSKKKKKKHMYCTVGGCTVNGKSERQKK